MCVCSAHIQENERGEGGRLVKTRSSIHITLTRTHRRAHVHVNTEKGARVDGFEWNCDDDCGNTNKGLSLGQLQCSFYVGTRETHAPVQCFRVCRVFVFINPLKIEEKSWAKANAMRLSWSTVSQCDIILYFSICQHYGMVHAQYRSAVGLCQFVLLLTLG